MTLVFTLRKRFTTEVAPRYWYGWLKGEKAVILWQGSELKLAEVLCLCGDVGESDLFDQDSALSGHPRGPSRLGLLFPRISCSCEQQQDQAQRDAGGRLQRSRESDPGLE